MQSISKILVCLDPTHEHQSALDRGVYLAKAHNASIELLLVVYNRGLVGSNFFSPTQLEAAKAGFINSKKGWIKQYQKILDNEGIKSTSSIIWHKPLYEGINSHAKKIGADLVIKDTHEHPLMNKIFFTPNDWQLLKSSQIPLILTKSNSKKTYKRVLAAIDPSHAHSKPESLDELIVSSAKNLSEQMGAECHITHCYSPIEYQLWSDIGIGMGVGMGPTDFMMGEENYSEYVNQLKDSQQKAFDKSIESFSFPAKQLHLVEGYPESLLPELVKELKIDLLVLGTTYHSGLVGSTAEKILEKVGCDVLSVQVKNS